MIEVRWHGRGGQGGWTVARILGMAAAIFEKRHALAFPSFGPERRGAPVLGFTKISDEKILDRSEVKACDYAVFLDETLINESTASGLKQGAKIVVNTPCAEKYREIFKGHEVFNVDATSVALSILKRPITNTAMLAALVAVSGIVSEEAVYKAVETEMKAGIREKNVLVVKEVFKILETKK